AVAQDALLAVDVGDRGRARRGVDEPDVEGDVTGRLTQGRDVQAVVPLDRGDDRQLELVLAVAERGGLLGHVFLLVARSRAPDLTAGSSVGPRTARGGCRGPGRPSVSRAAAGAGPR